MKQFFLGTKTAIPAKRAPRLLLLDLVAQAFEPGRRYPELALPSLDVTGKSNRPWWSRMATGGFPASHRETIQ